MALTQRLDLRQSQALVMTPQLQQAIKLLQLSNIELEVFVEAEIEQNPLLERDEGGAPEEGGESPAEGRIETVERDTADYAYGDSLPAEGESPLDIDAERAPTAEDGTDIGAVEAGLANWKTGGSGSFDDDDRGIEETLSKQVTLRDHLIEQLNVDIVDPVERIIALHLIDMLDEAGYLVGELAQVAAVLGCPVERVEATLLRLQRFDPAGVFARNLAECLSLQLADRNRLDPAMAALLANLPILAARDFPALLGICGVDAEDLKEMIAEIKALNPKPGQAFERDIAQTVVPDITMRAQPGGGWLVELNSDTLPRVLVNTRYFTRVNRNGLSKTDKEYLNERLQSANWLVKSLHQRANTILKVASEIVRQQDSFFVHGVQHLRPLILRDIAEAIGMHESTVSRVTTNKYLASPRGIYELKYFFSSAIASTTGAVHSAEAVRHRIKLLIDQETAEEVLSDDRIVEILLKDGVDIARRTVAKYREALRIPSSVERRRAKKGAALRSAGGW
jgi:RNA polymerase sigma-54 factor